MRQKSSKSDVLAFLVDREGEYLSGQQMAEDLGLSRNAVWKAIRALQEEGYPIESKSSLGYCLADTSRLLTQTLTELYVDRPCTLQVLDEVGSTNDLVKAAPAGDLPLVIIANRQTKGRGRYGRQFLSPAGTGIYLSVGVRPDFDITTSPFVTMAAAVAVCRAIKTVTDYDAEIKWVNDIFCEGKKVCGILTEAQTDLETGGIDRLVIGIGVNCYPGSFPPELAEIAGTLSEFAGDFSRARLAAEITNEVLHILGHIEDRRFLDEYRRRCFVPGREVLVHPTLQEEGFLAEALAISDDGGLIVRFLEGPQAGTQQTLRTGEVSVRVQPKEFD